MKTVMCFRQLEIPTRDQQSSLKIFTFCFKVVLVSCVVFLLRDYGRLRVTIPELAISVASRVF